MDAFIIHKVFCLFLFLYQLNNPPAFICFFSHWLLFYYSAGCGANRFGASCEALCSKTKEHCRRMVLCRPQLGCNCASGLKGVLCNTCEYWNKAWMLLWKVMLDYFIDSFCVCIKVLVSYLIIIEQMQQFSLYEYMQMTSAPDTLYNMKSVKLSLWLF